MEPRNATKRSHMQQISWKECIGGREAISAWEHKRETGRWREKIRETVMGAGSKRVFTPHKEKTRLIVTVKWAAPGNSGLGLNCPS